MGLMVPVCLALWFSVRPHYFSQSHTVRIAGLGEGGWLDEEWWASKFLAATTGEFLRSTNRSRPCLCRHRRRGVDPLTVTVICMTCAITDSVDFMNSKPVTETVEFVSYG